MALRCPKCGKEMVKVGKFWVCGNHPEPVSIPIETVPLPSVHPFSDLCAVLPTPIAFVLDEFFREVNPFVAIWRMVDAAEIITRFFTITVLSDILRQKGEFPEPVQNALTEKLERPTFGAWKDLLAIAIDNLPKERGQIRCFVSELPSFVRDKWLPALGSGEDKPEEKLIALRNLIAHAGRLSDEKAQELLNAHRQRFESLVKELSFLANYDLIACTKEGQIVWLKGLPDASGSFPEYVRSLPFVPEQGRGYLVQGGEGLDLFPLHAFTDILQWREERYDFESLGEVAPQIYFRLSERGYLEYITFSNRAVFSHLGKDAYQRFRDIFRLEEWRAQRRRKAEAQGIQTLWNELVRELTEVFVGREEHIKQVKDAIKGTSKGVLWISGKPGVGKSALMAKLMQDYIGQTQHYIVIPYFFHYGQAGCSTMDFLATALKRLQGELNRTIKPEPRLPDRQQQLVEALEEAASKTGKKVLFLVDGLDEIYRQEREFLNVPFMTIRERIVWVCAGRSEGDLEETLKSRGAVWVFLDGLPPLDEQAIREMLVEHLGRLKYALFERDEGERNRFVETVTRKSEGLPLYVRMVIEDLKAGRFTVWDEEKLPEGLVNYYERLLERLRVSDVGTVLAPLFCLLAWAKEPITEGTMNFLLQTHHLAGTPRWGELFRKALEHGHLMLQQRPTPDGETGWTIYHDSFRRHLLESETVSVSREWAQERWLEVCKDWKALASQEPSLHRYILHHHADHLYERWQSPVPDAQSFYSELCQLAIDPDFAQAQTQYLPDEPNLPLKTVQLALDAAIKKEDAPMMARLLIEHAKRAQGEEETPLQAWRKGYRERALRMAMEIIFERDHKLGTLWSLLLAWVAESEGKSEEERSWAKRFLDEIRKRWEGAKLAELRDWRGEMAAFLLSELGQVEGAIETVGLVLDDERKGDLAIRWASKGLFDQALKVVDEKIGTPWERAAVLNAIAVKMAEAGIFDQALKVARGIKEAGYGAYAWGLREITREMAKAGMFEQALKVVDEEIEEEQNRAWALSAIAGEMAKVGMKERAKEVFEQALKVAEGIYWDAWGRAWALSAIAGEMAKAGMLGDALKVAGKIQDQGSQTEALMAIAVEMAKVGMEKQAKEVFGEALKVALRIEGAPQQAMALGAIAAGMAGAGMFEQAWRVAEKVGDEWEQVKALGAIAKEMAKAGMMEGAKEVFDQALKVAEEFRKAVDRAVALREIVEGVAKAGMVERAKEVFEQALKVAEEIGEAGEQARALSEIAAGMARAGITERAKEVFEQALKVTEGIKEEGTFWWQAWALGAIAAGMAKVGMFEQALKVAKGIENAWERADTLVTIAGEMAKAGMFEQALKVAEGIENAWGRADALRGIAGEMAKAEMFEQDLKVVDEEIERKQKRADALREIAGEMAKVGMSERAKEVFEKALKVAEEIGEAWDRARALSEIATGMAKAGMMERAKEVFDQALKVGEGIEEEAFWWRAWALGAIAAGMAKAGMFKQALKVAEGIEEEFWRAWTLGTLLEIVHGRGEWVIPRSRRAWALWEVAGEMTKAGIKGRAMEVFYQALREAIWRARALKWVAEEMTKAGEVEGVADIVERATGLRTEMLPSVLEVLAERAGEGDEKSKEGFLGLLPLCGWSLELAYKACGLLAWLYPEQGVRIAEEIIGGNLSG
jgi:tetratricopeptide (TPR) repeat protein